MHEELADFVVFCRVERRLADATCRAYERDVRACLGFLAERGVRDLGAVRSTRACAIRFCRSIVEARVNETATMHAGDTCSSASSQHTRFSIVADLPAPGPATTRTCSEVSCAARCCAVSASSI
jgi:site-specific recombinase XerD